MARGYGERTGMDVWYPIYPPITEVNITITLKVLYETYSKMFKKYGAEHIAIVGNSMGGLFAAGRRAGYRRRLGKGYTYIFNRK